MKDDIYQLVRDFITADFDRAVKLREELHQIPEPGLHLPQTLQKVRGEFENLGLEIHDAREVSGFVAILRGGADHTGEQRPLVLLRADMDALPVAEETNLSWASTNGAMHACGHDMHMAGIITTARALTAVQEKLPGDVLFFLQPGEEGDDGAQFLIDDGLLEAAGRLPDHAYGLHVWSANYPTGVMTSRPGPLMASSDILRLSVQGKGGHGSAPHMALDPVPVIAEMITQSQVMVAREFNIFDPVVVTCGRVIAGSAPNVIADTAQAEFTLRAFSEEARQRLIDHLRRLFTGVAQAHGMEVTIEVEELYPVTVNDPQEYDYVAATLSERYPDRWSELPTPVGAAEDFSKILQRIPGSYVFVSAVPSGTDPATAPYNHSPKAYYDSGALTDCSMILAELALGRLLDGGPAQ